MKKIFKLIVALTFVAVGSASVYAQQITKFGVVDTAKVYQAYFRNSAPVRNYENKKAEFQKEINKLTNEIQNLNDQKIEYEKRGDENQVLKLEASITKKSQYLTEYASAKNTELETLKRSLQQSDSFYKKLYEVLARVAETGGYSMILNLQESNAILWYSTSVDVTDQVIAQLGL